MIKTTANWLSWTEGMIPLGSDQKAPPLRDPKRLCVRAIIAKQKPRNMIAYPSLCSCIFLLKLKGRMSVQTSLI